MAMWWQRTQLNTAQQHNAGSSCSNGEVDVVAIETRCSQREEEEEPEHESQYK